MELTERAKAYAASLFAGNADGHDYAHTLRVYETALRLAKAEGADETVVGLAALLHDADDHKLSPDTAGTLGNAAAFLRENGVDAETAARVLTCIRETPFHAGLTPTTPEGRCVQDADRLDAIGAVGIARTFAFGGSRGRPMYDPAQIRGVPGGNDTVSHFYDKLLRLKDGMRTAAGRALAEERHAFMLAFLREFEKETGCDPEKGEITVQYKEIDPMEFSFAPFREIGKNWGILTGQSEEGFNSMTVSWGAAGVLWGKPCVFVFVRPQRYTFGFLNDGARFSLALMPAGFQKRIAVFGSQSGRDTDKYAVSGLEAPEWDGVRFCGEADTVFVCKKIAAGDFTADWFLDDRIAPDNYPEKDYHRVFIGEIETILKKN